MKIQWNSLVIKILFLVISLNLIFGLVIVGLTSKESIDQYNSLLNDGKSAQLDNIKSEFELELYKVESSVTSLGQVVEEMYKENMSSTKTLNDLEENIALLFSDYLNSEKVASFSIYTYLEPNNEKDIHDVWITKDDQNLIRHDKIPYERYQSKDNMDWFFDAKETENSNWISPYNTQDISSYIMPLYYNDEFIGIIGMHLNMNHIKNQLSQYNESEDDYYWIMNQNNEIVYHPEYGENTISEITIDTSQSIPLFFDVPVDGERHRHYLSPTHNGWTIINSIKYKTLIEFRTIMFKKIFISLIFFSFTYISLICFFVMKYTNTINKMVHALKKAQTGNFSEVVPIEFNDEIGTLSHVINDTLETISNEQNKLKRLSYFSIQSHLPNLEKLKHDLQLHNNTEMILYLLDLDNYRTINELLGKEKSNTLMHEISNKLLEIEETDLKLYHISGDEFAFLDTSPELSKITSHANYILESLRKFTFSTEYNITISGTIGIARYPDDVSISGGLIECAGIALSLAKQEGKNKYKIFSRFLPNSRTTRLSLIEDFKQAVENNDFIIHYQPMVDKDNQRICLEALTRWVHPTEGLLHPEQFLEIAESTGLLSRLSTLILTKVCRDYHQLKQDDNQPLKIVVNLAHRQLLNPLFISNILSVFKQENINPEVFSFDITEDIVTYDLEQSINKLKALNVIGIGVILADFGKGSSSIRTLKELPIQKLKIDSSLIRDLHDDDVKSLVKGIIQLGHQLDLIIVAECVESFEQYQTLLSMNCDEFQGYYFQEPLEKNLLIQKNKEKSIR
ncbi:MAG: EAL domain-containing protein [Clostridiales bacterium]|nr:EAL domain-containing protein [Clostridiales bacterium]